MINVQTVLEQIAADAEHGDILFPTHCEIALRVQKLLDDPNCSTEALSRLVSAEPILSTRVLALSNATAYNPSGRRIEDLKTALTRIGFAALRAIAAAVIIRQMQAMPPLPAHRALAAQLWEHTAHVAALARVLARRVTHQNPDTAFYAGIVHECGIFYLIARAADYPELLESELEILHEDGEARIGRAVLAALEVPQSVQSACETLWSGYLAMPPHTLGDTLLLADEISPVESPLDRLSGMSRGDMTAEIELLIDDETLTDILAESAGEVSELCAALNA